MTAEGPLAASLLSTDRKRFTFATISGRDLLCFALWTRRGLLAIPRIVGSRRSFRLTGVSFPVGGNSWVR